MQRVGWRTLLRTTGVNGPGDGPRASGVTDSRPPVRPKRPLGERGLRMTVPRRDPSSTIPVAGQCEGAGLIDGSDFLPYLRSATIQHNKWAPVGRRPRTMAGEAHEGACRLRIQYSPQSEGERGVRSAVRSHPYWVGQKGYEGFMPLSRWSTGVPRSEVRGQCGRLRGTTATPTPVRTRSCKATLTL